MGNMNYSIYGKTYIFTKQDIQVAYKFFMNFYMNVLYPVYGKAKSCTFHYNRLMSFAQLGVSNGFKSESKILPLTVPSEERVQVFVLLESLAAMGIVSPFFDVNVTFDIDVQNLSVDSLLTTRSGRGKNTGFFKLVGKIKGC